MKNNGDQLQRAISEARELTAMLASMNPRHRFSISEIWGEFVAPGEVDGAASEDGEFEVGRDSIGGDGVG